MARGKKSASEKDTPQRARGKAAGKQGEDVLQHMDVEVSPHLAQMSLAWQRVYSKVANVVKRM